MVVINNNTNNNVNNNATIFRRAFRECLKNHAVNKGGHALDGCCEFLPAGPEGSIDALKCDVCSCHRNFHREEAPLPPIAVAVAPPSPTTVVPAGDAYPPYNTHRHQAAAPPQYVYHLPKGLLHVTAAPPNGGDRPFGLSPISPARGGSGGEDHDHDMDHDNGGIGSSSNSKKRFRTKFTPELKEKMKAFAERMDWRIQKQDDDVVQEFCNENGVNYQVLKVWMQNNKHTIGKKP